jgi:predicted transcriptional regulator of viral defense system
VATAAAGLPDLLLSRGTTSFTAEEAAQLTAVPLGHVYPALKRLTDRGLIFSPARGFYVPIPPEFRSWRSVPATHFVDAMMRHLGRRYYVGLLSAAELHGAAHQRPQTFQIMVQRSLLPRRAGRVDLRFYLNTRLDTAATTDLQTPTGTIEVATPETTVLDLAARPGDSGGLDNVATVLIDLATDSRLDIDALAAAAADYPASAVRRAGWILDNYANLGVGGHVDPRSTAPTKLDPHGDRRGRIDPVWHLIVNTDIEPDA